MKRMLSSLVQFFALLVLTCLTETASLAQSFQATPLIDFKPGELYLGEFQGFLYEGSNRLPSSSAHASEGLSFLSKVQPLDVDGNPNPNGQIVVLGF